MPDIQKKIQSLRDQLNDHNYRYYVLDDPHISDSEYDQLFRQLQKLEEDHPELVAPDSPTQRVGAEPLAEFGSITHRRPMLSLANAMDEGELRVFDERVKKGLDTTDDVEYMAEPKLDGLAVELIYEKGIFTNGSTRGDGITGEDTYPESKDHFSDPPFLRTDIRPAAPLLEVRGEVFMTKEGSRH